MLDSHESKEEIFHTEDVGNPPEDDPLDDGYETEPISEEDINRQVSEYIELASSRKRKRKNIDSTNLSKKQKILETGILLIYGFELIMWFLIIFYRVEEEEPEDIPEPRRAFRRSHSRCASLKFSKLDLTPARLTRSLSMTSLEDLEALHTILDTVVAERGANLSGGLAQSVALARVYVRKQAKIVILDESIGQMDNYKKRSIIFPQLFEFIAKNNMTLIMVSHDMVCTILI